MKKSFTQLSFVMFLCFLICMSTSCNNQEIKKEHMEMKAKEEIEVQNKTIVHQLYDAIDKQDFDKFQQLCTLGGVCHVAGIPQEIPMKNVVQVIQSYYKAFPDSTHVIKDTIAEGDKVVVRFIQKGTHRGEYEGIAPTGKEINVEAIHILRLKEGKISEVWIVEDNLNLMMQLGMKLKSESEIKK